jgi:hypothetical protein
VTDEKPGPLLLNLGCGRHRAPEPWVNLDVHSDEHHCPDVVVDPEDPFGGFGVANVDRIYLGHVLEHVRWTDVPELLDGALTALKPGGMLLATGPDVYRTIKLWREGAVPWDLVESVLEHADQASTEWPQAVHWWNCSEERLVTALIAAGFGIQETGVPPGGWPVVGWSGWQCAALAFRPG